MTGPAFVGRAHELELLRAQRAAARAGHARVVLVEGPSGVGKSALLRAALSGTDPSSILWSGGEEAEELVRFGIVDQLARAGARVGRPMPAADTGDEAPSVGAALLAALDAAAEPLVLVVDDAQWADLPSLQALVFALRRLGRAPALTLVAARDGAGDRIDGVRRLADAGPGHSLRLGGLAPSELTELGHASGHGRLPARAAARLHAHTGGLPLHARALFEELSRERLRSPDTPLPAPATYAALVGDRLAGCSPAARTLIGAAAVLGERSPLQAARRIAADEGVAAGPAVIGEVVAGRLVSVDASGADTMLVFDHRPARAAVLQSLDVTVRLRLHARAARLPGGTDEVLGHRVAACLDTDPDLAADLARRADDLEARGELARAGGHRLTATRVHPDPDGRAHALLRAAETFVLAGEVERAEALRAPVSALDDGARRDYVLALLEFARGRSERAEELLRRAWGATTEPDLLARVAERLCHVCYLQLRHQDAIDWGVRARAHDPRHVFPLVTSLALAGRDAQDPGAGHLLGDPEAAVARGASRLWSEDLTGAHAELGGAVRALRGSGRFMARLQATGYLVLAEYRAGRWEDAVRHAEEVVSLARDADQTWVLARLQSYSAMANGARGDLEHARADIAAARDAAAVTGQRLDDVGATIAAGHVASYAGDHAEVVALLEPLVRAPGPSAQPGVSQWPCLLSDALVRLGRSADAHAVLEPYERRAIELGRTMARSAAARSRARIEAVTDRVAALASVREAVGLADAAGAAVEGAFARVDEGALLRRAGRRREAAQTLRDARVRLIRIGAGPELARCDRELDACGLSPAGRRAPAPGRLTPRELAVARLAADGLSNPQVAAELVVSLNTVEFHLRNVFTKLDIGSRTDIAGHLAGRP